LLNTVLTVEKSKAHSHAKIGWETLTDRLISELNEKREQLVFVLWGAHAQKKGAKIDRNRHLGLTSVHPSPLSAYRGFFECGHFTKTNQYLVEHGLSPIDWSIRAQFTLNLPMDFSPQNTMSDSFLTARRCYGLRYWKSR